MTDPRDALTVKRVKTIWVPPGNTQVNFEVRTGKVYRVEVIVEDEAGNVTKSSVLLDLAGAGGCGCGAGGGASGGLPSALPLLLAFGLMLVTLRRRRTSRA